MKHDTREWSIATRALHADDALSHDNDGTTDIAPAMHVSTTFRYPADPELLVPAGECIRPLRDPFQPASSASHVYSRISAPTSTRLEAILGSLLQAPCLTYASGLAAFHAVLVHLRPRVVAIGEGYHGVHGVLRVYRKLTQCVVVNLHDPESWAGGSNSDGTAYMLGEGDLVHLETPLNPSGEAYDVAHYAELAHRRGARLSVDATFAPPPLLDPFRWGADYVLHSATKYFGGHSDMLCGVLAVNPRLSGGPQATIPPASVTVIPREDAEYDATTTSPLLDGRTTSQSCRHAFAELYQERYLLGATVGSLESWLGVRSLRTLQLRVQRQSSNATSLVARLSSSSTSPILKGTISRISHASLQPSTPWLQAQMPNGFPPVFGLYLASPRMARRLPSTLALFHHATSLGGVESLIEWRALSDDTVDKRLLRVSVGVEDVADLYNDLIRGLEEVAREEEEHRRRTAGAEHGHVT